MAKPRDGSKGFREGQEGSDSRGKLQPISRLNSILLISINQVESNYSDERKQIFYYFNYY